MDYKSKDNSDLFNELYLSTKLIRYNDERRYVLIDSYITVKGDTEQYAFATVFIPHKWDYLFILSMN